MIGYEKALETARAYVAQERPGCFVKSLSEDDKDYGVNLGLEPGMEWPIGPGFIFISKGNGKVFLMAPGEGILKFEGMR